MRLLLLVAFVALLPLSASAQHMDRSLETIRNYTYVDEHLASAGQVPYDRISTLAEDGYEVVINLAPASDVRNAMEGYLVTKEGLTYLQIPVDWQNPSMRDLQLFFDVMKANQNRKVFVHCFANMRASAFVYLYRTLHQDVSEEEAAAVMAQVWNPDEVPQWGAFIEQAKAEFAD
ncbi:MAG: protein tyrosine phosphatase family protein [Rhodothermales bacterium]